ncbi:hypothetical protein [Methanobrevibacter sp.]
MQPVYTHHTFYQTIFASIQMIKETSSQTGSCICNCTNDRS